MPLRARLKAVFCLAAALAAAVIIIAPQPPMASAASSESPRNKGLYITPVRKFLTVDAGTAKDLSVTVGNFTDDPMTVKFSVQQFTVADYSYSFQFQEPANDWVSFGPEQIVLKSNESKVVPYRIAVPRTAKPGGQYYTLFATGAGQRGDASQQIQTTSLLYLTVSGQLTHTSGLSDSSIRHLVWRGDVPFTLDITNTGNIHYFTYVSADLRGPFTNRTSAPESHLLLPGTTRHLSSSIPPPILPGLYRASYGYKTEFQKPVTRVSRILYIPIWSVATFLVLAWAAWVIFRRVRRSRARRRKRQGVAARGAADDSPKD